MLSRVAESVYWMSRYLERADNVARFIDVNMHLLMDLGMEADKTQWHPLVLTSGDEDDFYARYAEADEPSVVHFLTFDGQNPNSILSCISHARENARTIREAIPSEQWEALNELYHLVQQHQRKRNVKDLKPFYHAVRKSYEMHCGVAHNTMSRGQGWHFAKTGRLLERADKTARLIDVKYFLLLPEASMVDSPTDAVQWGSVLRSASAFEMYRKRFHRLHYHDVVQFLLFDMQFPRSVRYCVDGATESLSDICEILDVPAKSHESFCQLRDMLARANTEKVMASGLHEYIDDFQQQINGLHDQIHAQFFA